MRAALVSALALAALAVTPARADDDARAHHEQGQRLYNLGKFREAIAEFEAAYKLDPDPVYLFNLAQAYRLDTTKDPEARLTSIERAEFFYHRFLALSPDAPNKAEVDDHLETLEDERVVVTAARDKAIAEAAAAEAARRAAAPTATTAAATAPAPAPPADKHVRIAVDVGSSIIYLDGDRQSPQLSGRVLVAYMRRLGKFTLDLGGSWQLTTLPYENTDGDNVSASYTQLHAVAAVMRTIYGPFWARIGIGIGFAAFGNLQAGNPLTAGMLPSTDVRMFCARADSVAGYRYNQTIDFVLGLTSASYARPNKILDERLDRVTTLEGFYLGIYIKL